MASESRSRGRDELKAKNPLQLRCRTSDESCDKIARLATHCSRCIVYSKEFEKAQEGIQISAGMFTKLVPSVFKCKL